MGTGQNQWGTEHSHPKRGSTNSANLSPVHSAAPTGKPSQPPPKQGAELGQPLGFWMNQGLVGRKKAQSTEPAPNGKKNPKLLYFCIIASEGT